MKKEFVPYEEALDLKELGFDEPCLFAYNQDDENKFMTAPQLSSYQINSGKNSDKGELNKVTAPLYQQAFRWFREKYNLKGHVEAIEYFDETPDTYHWSILNEYNSGNDQLTYEEAELECLKKLIEIVKQK